MRLVSALWLAVAAVLLASPFAMGQGAADPRAEAFARHAPPILSRADWKAKPALPGLKAHIPRSIVVHHTAVRRNAKASLERKLIGLQNFSQQEAMVGSRRKPVWPDIPYHFYIDMTGRLGEARDPNFMGDSNTSYNLDGHVQVVVEGDFEQEQPSEAQLKSLADTLLWLSLRWNVPVERISTHKDNAATTCPGRRLTSELPKLLADVHERRARAVAELCAASPAADLAQTYCAGK